MMTMTTIRCEAGFTFPDVLLLIGMKGLTGELVVESGNNIGSMIFKDGRILQAFSPYSRALGDILVDDGLITETELFETLHEQKQLGHVLLGTMFMKSGKVQFEVIEAKVHGQIRLAVRDFLAWAPLDVSFVHKEVAPVDTIHLPVTEFIPPELIQAARTFSLAAEQQPADDASSTTAAAPSL